MYFLNSDIYMLHPEDGIKKNKQTQSKRQNVLETICFMIVYAFCFHFISEILDLHTDLQEKRKL